MMIFRDKFGHRWTVHPRSLLWHLRWLKLIGRIG